MTSTICMCGFLLVTETHICATTKRFSHEGALLIALFYYPDQPLAHNEFITHMTPKQHNRILQRACSKHSLNIQSGVHLKPGRALYSTEN